VVNRITSRAVLVVVSASALAAAAGFAGGVAPGDTPAHRAPATNPEAVRLAGTLSEAFRGAVAAIKPSVVSILAEHGSATAPAAFQGQGPDEEFFKQFFGGQLPEGMSPRGMPKGTPGPRHAQPAPHGDSEGSGVVVRADGYIVTNNHVVDGATKLTVHLDDGRDLAATVVGTDPETDLAVVKVDASDLTPGTLGDSDAMQPGDWVVAVGSPFGLHETVTAGIVSAVGRTDVGVGAYENFIQTDTPINPGNSGGPLVNLSGQVIGINTAIRTTSGGSNGIGFAIPSSTVSSVSDTLIAKGHVERGWLGVSVQALTKDLAASFKAPIDSGVLVSDVMPDSPAAKAGLQSGDTITSVDDKAVKTPRELTTAIGTMAPGKEVSLHVLHEGKAKTIKVDLGTRPGAAELAAGKPGDAGLSGSMGLSVQPLTPDLAQQLGVPDQKGLAVSEVAPDSAAAKAGLQDGDVILKAGDRAVDTIEGLRAAWDATAKDQGLLLKVRRGGTSLFLVLKHQA
jgi:serine protease Do